MSRVQRGSHRLRLSTVQHPRYASARYGCQYERRLLQSIGLRAVQTFEEKAYPIVCSKPEQAPAAARELTEKGEPLDFIFFDLPGTINNPGIVNTLAAMDYIFTPMSADKAVMRSSLKFASVINEHLITTGKTHIKGLYLLWNMVDGREKTDLYEIYEKICAEMALTVMKTSLPDSKRFRKETATERKAVFRSTLFPADKTLIRGSNLNKLVEEILSIIQK